MHGPCASAISWRLSGKIQDRLKDQVIDIKDHGAVQLFYLMPAADLSDDDSMPWQSSCLQSC